MSVSKEYTRYEGLFAYCIKNGLITEDMKKVLIVDCDIPDGALISNIGGLLPNVDRVIPQECDSDPFRNLMAEFGSADDEAAFSVELLGAKNAITRYIKSKGSSDDEVVLAGKEVLCSYICSICNEYADKVKEIVANADIGMDVSVILLGLNTVLYPIEHAVRSVLSPIMPFNPIPNLVASSSCAVNTDDAYAEGVQVLSENSKANTPLAHNISLQLISHHKDGGKPSAEVLALEGTEYADLAEAKYTRPVFALANEPIVLFAGSKPYELTLPRSVFRQGIPGAVVSFALGLQDDVPTLLVRGEDGACGSIVLEKQIYTEDTEI